MNMLKQAFITLVDGYKSLTVNEFAKTIKERDEAIKEMDKN